MKHVSPDVLLIEDDASVRLGIEQTLELNGLETVSAGSFVELRHRIVKNFQGVILCDVQIPGRDGFHVLSFVRNLDQELPVILLTGVGDIPMAVRAMTEGATAFLEKPCGISDLMSAIRPAIEHRRKIIDQRRQFDESKPMDAADSEIAGTSATAARLRAEFRSIARVSWHVTLIGEPGTPLSALAGVLHKLGAGCDFPFIKAHSAALDAAGLKDALAEARGGTLWLDDVCALPIPVQAALANRLECCLDTRGVAGAKRALGDETKTGRLLEALANQLGVIQVKVPCLAERPEDPPQVYLHHLRRAYAELGKTTATPGPDQLAALLDAEGCRSERDIANAARRHALGLVPRNRPEPLGFVSRMSTIERHLLVEALSQTRGNATDAARMLQLSRKTFYDKLSRHDLRACDFRE